MRTLSTPRPPSESRKERNQVTTEKKDDEMNMPVPTWRGLAAIGDKIGWPVLFICIVMMGLVYQSAVNTTSELRANTAAVNLSVREMERVKNVNAQLDMSVQHMVWVIAQFCVNSANTAEERRRCMSITVFRDPPGPLDQQR